MRGSKKTIVPTERSLSQLPFTISIVSYSNIKKTGTTLTITQGEKFGRDCNELSNSNTNSLKKEKQILNHSKNEREKKYKSS